MSINITGPEPRISPARAFATHVLALLKSIAKARAEGKVERKALADKKRRELERYRNGYLSLGVSIRTTTRNHGRLGPR